MAQARGTPPGWWAKPTGPLGPSSALMTGAARVGEDASVGSWALRVADAVTLAELDTTHVAQARCPRAAAVPDAVRAVVSACSSVGLEAIDLTSDGWEGDLRRSTPGRSIVAVLPHGCRQSWARLLTVAIGRWRLQGIVIVTDAALGDVDSRGTHPDASALEYPDVPVERVYAAEARGTYGLGRGERARSAAWQWRARAAWHHRRGDGSAVIERLRRAADAAARAGEWPEALRSARAAVEASLRGGSLIECVSVGAWCARVLLELGHTGTAAQAAIVVLAATTQTSALATDAMLTLAEVAAMRGHWPLARGWLDRCAGTPTEARARALDMRLSLAGGDLIRAARAAHAIEDAPVELADTSSLLAAAEVHAKLGDAAGAARMLGRAAQLARARRLGGDAAWVRAAGAAISGRYGPRFSPLRGSRSGVDGRGRGLSPRARDAVRHLRTGEPPGGVALPCSARRGQSFQGWEPAVVNEVVTILRLSQEDADEVEIIERVCRALRDLWRATSVGVWRPGALTSPAAGVGRGDVSEELAARIASIDRVVGPSVDRDGSDAAIAATVLGGPAYAGVAIRYAGGLVGLLVLRWSSAPLVSGEHVVAVLSAAAVALGPAVAALSDRPREPTAPAADGWGLLGASACMHELRESVRRCATSPFPVLVVGESGSGKELVARAVHDSSLRRGRRFCAVNCAALTEELFDAELFGHVRGAFTGALHERKGLIEEADGGTLFLDEIGELSPRGQAKLLRVLQEREVRRVGENAPRRVDVRVIAATNRDLMAATTAGAFRLDLLYRLDVIRIIVPPLRARHEDVLLLAREYWRRAAEGVRTKASLSAEVLAVLARYHWPGNVRELQNVMTALAVSAPRRGRVERRHLPATLLAAQAGEDILPLLEARRRFDEEYVARALLRTGGSRAAAARLLGITRQGLAKMLARQTRAVVTPARGPEARAVARSA